MKKKEYVVTRNWLKYGNETDPVEQTVKYYDNFEKAYAYAKRYAKGVKFVSAEIEELEYEVDENGNDIGGTIKCNLLYGIYDYGMLEEDYRTKEELKEEMKIQIEPVYIEPSELEEESVEKISRRICFVTVTGISRNDATLAQLGFNWSVIKNCWFDSVLFHQVFDFVFEKFNTFENFDLESYYNLLDLLKAEGVEKIGLEWKKRWLTIALTEDVYKCYEETYKGHLGHRTLEKYRNPVECFTDNKKEKKQ